MREPDTDFAASLGDFAELSAREERDETRAGASVLLHHGAPTRRSFLLLHGYTSCPDQFIRVAEAVHAAGCNVFVPLAQGHGRADGSPHELTRLTSASIAEWVTDSVALAAGLGENLTVAGLSFGGVCAAWAACNLDEVAEAVIISPAFLPAGVPIAAARLVPAGIRVLPERYLWWNPVLKAERRMAPSSYRRLSRRGIGAVFELGQRVWREPAQRQSPLERATLVINARDRAISARAAERAFASALEPIATRSEVRLIGEDLGFPHDFLDPWGPIGEREPLARAWVMDVLGAADASDATVRGVDDR